MLRVAERIGWGGRDRTSEWRNQNPLPYRLATPQQRAPYSHRKLFCLVACAASAVDESRLPVRGQPRPAPGPHGPLQPYAKLFPPNMARLID